MQEADLAAADRLTRLACWNQIEGDWRTWLKLTEARAWVTEIDGRVVGSTTAIPYENRFGWVGMVLVDPDFRRQGVATNLVRTALHYLERKGCQCQKLDATSEGKEIYEKLGFRVEYQVQRWRRSAMSLPEPREGGQLAMIGRSLAPGLEALDRRAFGASRRELLNLFLHNGFRGYACSEPQTPSAAVSRPNLIRGYGFGRPGRGAAQIGPLVAVNPGAAGELMDRLRRDLGQSTIIADVAAGNRKATDLLERHGFSPVRHLVRMFRGPNAFPGQLEEIYCLAGFEWG